MGKVLRKLSEKKLGDDRGIFPNRFVIEVCEKFHVHFKNLRLMIGKSDWIEFANGVVDSFTRWKKRGEPEPDASSHIELCRKRLSDAENNTVLITLNENLYLKHDGKIFAEGAELLDDVYVHVKIRGVRLEFSKNDFRVIADAIQEAREIVTPTLESCEFA